MDFSEGDASEILDRLSSAYRVSTQKALAECLGVPAANVSNWLQRNSVPGSAFVKCVLDTGSDLAWLATGKFANASKVSSSEGPSGADLYKAISLNGGKPVMQRIMAAYGFTLQKQLCDLLGISSGTVSTWIRRNYFPGDVVVTCALDTGVPLRWLTLGEGPKHSANNNAEKIVSRKELIAGQLIDSEPLAMDLSFLKHSFAKPLLLVGSRNSWLIDEGISAISNGKWLLSVDSKLDVYEVYILPGKKINVFNNGNSFEFAYSEFNCAGKVILTFQLD